MSVTSLIHRFAEPFDGDAIAAKMVGCLSQLTDCQSSYPIITRACVLGYRGQKPELASTGLRAQEVGRAPLGLDGVAQHTGGATVRRGVAIGLQGTHPLMTTGAVCGVRPQRPRDAMPGVPGPDEQVGPCCLHMHHNTIVRVVIK
eukprot:6492168-Amphidinium_carterae.6